MYKRRTAVLVGVLLALQASAQEPGTAGSSVPPDPASAATGAAPADPATGRLSPLTAAPATATGAPVPGTAPERGSAATSPEAPSIRDEPREAEPGNLWRQQPASATQELPGISSTPLPVVMPDDAYLIRSEWLLLSDSVEAANNERRTLSGYGLKLDSRRAYERLGVVLSRFITASPLSPADSDELLKRIRSEHPRLVFEYNQAFYPATATEPQRWGQRMTGWSKPCTDKLRGRIALIDSKVNAALEQFASANLTVDDVTGDAPVHTHGTSIAAMWLSPEIGVAPYAEVHAINVFSVDEREHLRTTTWYLLDGINRAFSANPDAVNLSFGGMDSFILSSVLDLVSEDAVLVAAAGNSGPNAPPAFPAAHEAVVAVSAVDIDGKLYRKANRGAYVDLLAPGVDIWTINSRGKGYYATGTSFAAPWVTAYALLDRDISSGGAAGGAPKALSFQEICSI